MWHNCFLKEKCNSGTYGEDSFLLIVSGAGCLSPFTCCRGKNFCVVICQKLFVYFHWSNAFLHVYKKCDMSFIVACLSNIDFFNCSFFILKRFNTSEGRSHSSSRLSLVARKTCLWSTPGKGKFMLTPIPGRTLTVSKPLSNPVPGQELLTPSFTSQEFQPARHCAFSKLRNPQKACLWPTWPSPSRHSITTSRRGTICAAPKSRSWSACSMKLKMTWFEWKMRRKI